ncbi:MAG TPA: hypothetical protein VNZ44_08165, partial [Pyrinomonadaceae bacterium]|nr:hypothetical protein [Pyrinomonadaceae bacterium]
EVPPEADGLLLYCLPGNKSECEQLARLAEDSKARDQHEVLIAVPREVSALREAVRELELLHWVQNNTPALQSDAVARREIRARLASIQARTAAEIQRLFSPDEQTAKNTVWFNRGLRLEIPSARTLANFISQICDQVYSATPVLRNELVNRRQLSTAAAAARGILIDAMLKRGGEKRLGFTGTPPEVAIYASALEHTGIHRPGGAGYGFGAPSGDEGLIEVWRGIEVFFDGCELQRRTVKELFDMLQRRPYGLKMGVIPILFCAAALAHDTEVAFYESGAYLPEVTAEVYDRLIRSPDKFELRRYRVEGVRREVFRLMARLFTSPGETKAENLVSILKPLYRFFGRLPQYTKQTKNVPPTARAIKDALFSSKDPDTLLFDELPRACGVEPFAVGGGDDGQLTAFFNTLKAALLDLERAYDDLLFDLRALLFKAFGFEEGEARERLRARAAEIWDHCVDPRLKAFVGQLQGDQPEDVAWIASVATIVVGKEPRLWNDADRARYEITLADLARSFRHIEALVFEETAHTRKGQKPEHILRIGVSEPRSKDLEAVVVVGRNESLRYEEAVVGVTELLERLGVDENPELALAALASVSQKLLSDLLNAEPNKVSGAKVMVGRGIDNDK